LNVYMWLDIAVYLQVFGGQCSHDSMCRKLDVAVQRR
jgi:hypothetical protein